MGMSKVSAALKQPGDTRKHLPEPDKYRMYGGKEDPSFTVKIDRPTQVIRQYIALAGPKEILLVPGETYKFMGTKQNDKGRWVAVFKNAGSSYWVYWSDLMYNSTIEK